MLLKDNRPLFHASYLNSIPLSCLLPPPTLINLLPQFDVISFDVFDTLLFRTYLTQEDLWAEMDCQIGAGGKFLRLRLAADKTTYDAATRCGGEHTLAEAYRLMPRKFAALEAKEERLQRECLQANKEMLAVWKRAGELGKKRIIVSDMYLSEAWFAETLKEKGFGDYDALYVSSARQARKSSGKLFDIVRNDFPTAKVLHIGDHAHSDVDMAKAHGFAAYKVDGPVELFLRDFPFVKEFLNDFHEPAVRRTVAAMALGWMDFGKGVDYWAKLGFIHAGLLGTIFIRWIAARAKTKGIDTLWFVARDGYVWQRLCRILCPWLKTKYVYAPRAVLTCATSDIGTGVYVRKDRCGVLARKLRFDASAADDDSRDGKAESDYKDLSSRIEAVLTGKAEDAAVSAALRQLNETTLADYRAYLTTLPGDLSRMAVVDGCSKEFSVQRLLNAVTGKDIPAFYLASMAPMHNAESLFATEGNTLPFQYLTEFLFGSPEHPIADVKAEGPIYGESSADEAFKESVSESICRGAEACARALAGQPDIMSPSLWANWVEEFMRGMTEEDREHLAKARNSTDIHHRVFEDVTWQPRPKCRPINRPWLARLGVRVRWGLREGVSQMRLTFGPFTLYRRQWRIFRTNETLHEET